MRSRDILPVAPEDEFDAETLQGSPWRKGGLDPSYVVRPTKSPVPGDDEIPAAAHPEGHEKPSSRFCRHTPGRVRRGLRGPGRSGGAPGRG